jgi:hypothetical protein
LAKWYSVIPSLKKTGLDKIFPAHVTKQRRALAGFYNIRVA